MDLSVNGWKYRGEGNSCLVVASERENVVYRFMKRNADKEDKKDTDREIVQRNLNYVENVMIPLLGNEYVVKRSLVEVSLQFVCSINSVFRHLRPPSRLGSEIHSIYAEKSLDFCQFPRKHNYKNVPTYCIEIKPKAGFLPTSSHIASSNNIKHKVCRHCLHQRLKLKENKWKTLSTYCPLDLFSGHVNRMHYALSSLALNPQNNLRIFKDGMLIYGCIDNGVPSKDDKTCLYNQLEAHFGNKDDPTTDISQSSVLQSLEEIIISALLNTSHCDNNCQHLSKKRKTEIQCNTRCAASGYKPLQTPTESCLPKGCVLYNLLKVQQFDDLDIEGIYPLYCKMQEQLSRNPTQYREIWNLDRKYKKGYVTSILDNSVVNGHVDVRSIKKFLVAMTAKDCSIMIALLPVDKTESNSQGTPLLEDKFGNKFQYHIQFADLDPKKFSNIPNYYEKDQKIVNEYNKNMVDINGTTSQT